MHVHDMTWTFAWDDMSMYRVWYRNEHGMTRTCTGLTWARTWDDRENHRDNCISHGLFALKSVFRAFWTTFIHVLLFCWICMLASNYQDFREYLFHITTNERVLPQTRPDSMIGQDLKFNLTSRFVPCHHSLRQGLSDKHHLRKYW